MAPHGKCLHEQTRNQMARLCKDRIWGYESITRRLSISWNTVRAVVSTYERNHTTKNRRCRRCPWNNDTTDNSLFTQPCLEKKTGKCSRMLQGLSMGNCFFLFLLLLFFQWLLRTFLYNTYKLHPERVHNKTQKSKSEISLNGCVYFFACGFY